MKLRHTERIPLPLIIIECCPTCGNDFTFSYTKQEGLEGDNDCRKCNTTLSDDALDIIEERAFHQSYGVKSSTAYDKWKDSRIDYE